MQRLAQDSSSKRFQGSVTRVLYSISGIQDTMYDLVYFVLDVLGDFFEAAGGVGSSADSMARLAQNIKSPYPSGMSQLDLL